MRSLDSMTELNDALIKRNQELLMRNGPLIEALNQQKTLIESITSLAVESGLDKNCINDYIVLEWLEGIIEENYKLKQQLLRNV